MRNFFFLLYVFAWNKEPMEDFRCLLDKIQNLFDIVTCLKFKPEMLFWKVKYFKSKGKILFVDEDLFAWGFIHFLLVDIFDCVTGQHYVLKIFTRLWSTPWTFNGSYSTHMNFPLVSSTRGLRFFFRKSPPILVGFCGKNYY